MYPCFLFAANKHLG